MKKKQFLIYALLDPRTEEVRYIGRSSSGLERPRSHLRPKIFSKSSPPLYRWLRALHKKNLIPSICVLWECETAEELNPKEVELIAYHKLIGAKLWNFTNGGDGMNGAKLSIEHRRKISLSLIGNKYLTMTPELKAKLSVYRKNQKCPRLGTKHSEESKQKMRLAKLGRTSNWKGKHPSEESRAKMRISQALRHTKRRALLNELEGKEKT